MKIARVVLEGVSFGLDLILMPASSPSDKNKMTTILGIHLVLLGLGAFLLVLKACYYGGLYDPWSPGGLETQATTVKL